MYNEDQTRKEPGQESADRGRDPRPARNDPPTEKGPEAAREERSKRADVGEAAEQAPRDQEDG